MCPVTVSWLACTCSPLPRVSVSSGHWATQMSRKLGLEVVVRAPTPRHAIPTSSAARRREPSRVPPRRNAPREARPLLVRAARSAPIARPCGGPRLPRPGAEPGPSEAWRRASLSTASWRCLASDAWRRASLSTASWRCLASDAWRRASLSTASWRWLASDAWRRASLSADLVDCSSSRASPSGTVIGPANRAFAARGPRRLKLGMTGPIV